MVAALLRVILYQFFAAFAILILASISVGSLDLWGIELVRTLREKLGGREVAKVLTQAVKIDGGGLTAMRDVRYHALEGVILG